MNTVNPRSKTDTYSTFKNVSLALNWRWCSFKVSTQSKKNAFTWKTFFLFLKLNKFTTSTQNFNVLIIFFTLIKHLAGFIDFFNVISNGLFSSCRIIIFERKTSGSWKHQSTLKQLILPRVIRETGELECLF